MINSLRRSSYVGFLLLVLLGTGFSVTALPETALDASVPVTGTVKSPTGEVLPGR